MSRQLLASILAACIAAWASPAPAQGLFDSPVQIAQAPVTKLPAGGLFGSLLASNGPTAECTCTDCKCANCGCTITTASEEEVVAAARAADRSRYIYTAYADGSWRAVPRRSSSAYTPTVVRSAPVYAGSCENGMCSVPSSSYSGYSYSSQERSYSGSAPYASAVYRGRGSYGAPFRRLFGGGRFRSCGPNGCN